MRQVLAVLVLLCGSMLAFSRPPVAWQRIYPMTGDQRINTAIQTADGGLIIGTQNYGSATGYLLKLDSAGEVVWTHNSSIGLWGGAEGIAATTDGGYVFVGTTGPAHLCAIKTDSAGNELWHYIDPDTTQTQGHAVAQMPDGGCVIAGEIFFPGHVPYTDVYAVRLDGAGTQLWRRSWGSATNDWGAYDVISADSAAGTILVVGSINREDWHPGAHATALRANGTPIWTQNYWDDSGFEKLYAGCRTPLGDLVAVGEKFWYSGGIYSDFFLECFSPSGAVRWQRVLGGSGTQYANSVVVTPENGIIVAGITNSGEVGGNDILLMGLDNTGTQGWDTVVGTRGNDDIASIVRAGDGGYFIAGATATSEAIGIDFLLIRLYPEGSDAAHPEYLTRDYGYEAYRLVHESGIVNRVIFTNYYGSASGRVGGAAGGNWSVLPNGDGNDGDSVIFNALTPLAAGVLDTFWLSTPQRPCSGMTYAAGCQSGSVPLLRDPVDSLVFSGALESGATEFYLRTIGEHDVARYEIYGWAPGAAPVLLTTVIAENGSGPHDYSATVQSLVYWRYSLMAVETNGCLYPYDDRGIWPGNGLPISESGLSLPQTYRLDAYPNPFNPATALVFDLPRAQRVKLAVYDLLGREVSELADEVMSAGSHQVTFDGANLPSGLYFARITSREFVTTQKLLLLK